MFMVLFNAILKLIMLITHQIIQYVDIDIIVLYIDICRSYHDQIMNNNRLP